MKVKELKEMLKDVPDNWGCKIIKETERGVPKYNLKVIESENNNINYWD